MKEIISASRRTDIPAWYPDRLISWIRNGAVDVPNPYSGAVSRVSLAPPDVHTMVLWSKNFGPLLDQAKHLLPYRLYFLFTVNDMPDLEPNIPRLADRIGQFGRLAGRWGAERIAWRFDPIVFSVTGPVTPVDAFSRMAEQIAGAGITRLIISFLDFYGKVRARNDALRLGLIDPPREVKHAHAEKLAGIARSFGFSVESCCEDIGTVPGIEPASCIDGKLLGTLAGEPARCGKDPGQRPECRCTPSRDIGSYRDMPCPSGCLYCYANPLIAQTAGGFR